MHEQYLMHWGIKGQKWGIRRYQNEDGSYTSRGKQRRKEKEEANYHEDYKRAHDKKPVSQMSDKELRDRNARLQSEKQYKELTSKKRYDKAKKFIKEALWISATTTALSAAFIKNKKMVNSFIDDHLDLPIFFNN